MKRISFIVLVSIVIAGVSTAARAEFSKMPKGKPQLIQSGMENMWCPVCGMSLKMYYKTSHAVILKDGKKKQYCSIRCLAVDYPAIKSSLAQTLVVDLKTEKLIDADKAVYVIGSKVPGTMTMVSKLAFSDEASANAFMAKMGGELGNFKTAFSKAQDSLQMDIAMTDKKKKTQMYPMGEKVFAKMCKQDIDPVKFDSINELKAYIKQKKLCKPVEEKQLQAVALYLWDVKRLEGTGSALEGLRVNNNEKCPVCGMFVYKFPRWAAQIFTSNDGKENHYSFDGAKDMLKYYLEPERYGAFGQKNQRIMVTDYYTQKGIDGIKAFYVIGSNVYGPMGKELIPFASKKHAETFLNDHSGKKIVSFDEITKELMKELE